MLPCLFPMVLSPRKSHSCEPTWMDNPIPSLRKANPLGSRIHSFTWKKVLFSSNEQNTNPSLPKMSHSEETRHLLASTNSSSRELNPDIHLQQQMLLLWYPHSHASLSNLFQIKARPFASSVKHLQLKLSIFAIETNSSSSRGCE